MLVLLLGLVFILCFKNVVGIEYYWIHKEL